MTTSVTLVGPESSEILTNLFEHYMHDMAEWFLFDTGPDGRYGYDMSLHWARGDRVYLARVGQALAGFALVGSAGLWLDDPEALDMKEFFVIRRYRRAGVGEHVAKTIWAAEPGRWLVRVLEANRPAVPFWRSIIARHTGGTQVEERRTVDERAWAFFTFRDNG